MKNLLGDFSSLCRHRYSVIEHVININNQVDDFRIQREVAEAKSDNLKARLSAEKEKLDLLQKEISDKSEVLVKNKKTLSARLKKTLSDNPWMDLELDKEMLELARI